MSATVPSSAPPNNLSAERSVLGAVLLDDRHLGRLVEEKLEAEHFYGPEHQAIFAAMLALYNSGQQIDHVTVAEQLRLGGELEQIGGSQAIEELAAWVPSTGNAMEYGRIVIDQWKLREMRGVAHQIEVDVQGRTAPTSELLERAERAISNIAHDQRQRSVRKVAEVLEEETERLHKRSVDKNPLTGTPSGYKDLDEMTGGFQPGNLIVIAARPSMGKSALVCNMAENAALAGHPVALFSLEMAEAELAQRFIASQSKTPGNDLRLGKVADSRWPKILEACSRLSDAPLFIDDSSDTSVMDVRAKARRLHNQTDGGLGLIIIDYLQLMRHEGRVENRVEQVGQISRGLKSLARELQVPVIALSQLSRKVEERAGDKKPMLSDLRESGSIEQDSDLVMFIFRDEYYTKEATERPGEADLILAKHRNGAVGEVKLSFHTQYPKFMNYAGERFKE
jgi:replicative DNA helicase